LTHDVRSAGAAEAALGAAVGFDNAVTVAIGTGVSAALSCDGRPIRANGFGGEIGHLRVSAEQVACVCGGVGCLEAMASASAIVKRYVHLSADDSVAGADEVIARAESGDPIALGVWNDALDGLATGLAALVATVAPEIIVIAGGLSGAGESLLHPLAERLAARVRIVPLPTLAVARFGSDAGIVGAALATRTTP
jgi:glucokinase